MTMLFDFLFFFAGWGLGQWLFQAYEAHVPWSKRLGKLLVMALVFVAVYAGLGRPYFYGLLVVMTCGMAILHGYWFHYRNGVHWSKAEPREKYLRLIRKT